MQLFNIINARKLHADEFNVFENFFNNFMFIAVMVTTFVTQIVMVEIGGMAIKTKSMNVQQNLICLLFGSGSLIWGAVIKFIPMKYF